MITLISNLMMFVYNIINYHLFVFTGLVQSTLELFANAGKGHIADKEHSAGLVECSIYIFYLSMFKCNNVEMWQSLI